MGLTYRCRSFRLKESQTTQDLNLILQLLALLNDRPLSSSEINRTINTQTLESNLLQGLIKREALLRTPTMVEICLDNSNRNLLFQVPRQRKSLLLDLLLVDWLLFLLMLSATPSRISLICRTSECLYFTVTLQFRTTIPSISLLNKRSTLSSCPDSFLFSAFSLCPSYKQMAQGLFTFSFFSLISFCKYLHLSP